MEKHEEIPRYKDSVWFKKKGGGSNSISPGDRGKQERTLTFSLLKGTHDDP